MNGLEGKPYTRSKSSLESLLNIQAVAALAVTEEVLSVIVAEVVIAVFIFDTQHEMVTPSAAAPELFVTSPIFDHAFPTLSNIDTWFVVRPVTVPELSEDSTNTITSPTEALFSTSPAVLAQSVPSVLLFPLKNAPTLVIVIYASPLSLLISVRRTKTSSISFPSMKSCMFPVPPRLRMSLTGAMSSGPRGESPARTFVGLSKMPPKAADLAESTANVVNAAPIVPRIIAAVSGAPPGPDAAIHLMRWPAPSFLAAAVTACDTMRNALAAASPTSSPIATAF